MIYLAWYLGIGFIVLTALYIDHKIRSKNEQSTLHDILEANDPDRDKLSYKFLNYVAAPLLGLFIWPLAIFMIAEDYFQKTNAKLDGEPPLFSVKAEHLIEKLNVADIETREMYNDPLQAVPNIPFGHLNTQWKNFISTKSEKDEVWAFKAEWETAWGDREILKGYVLARDGTPGEHFLTMRKKYSE